MPPRVPEPPPTMPRPLDDLALEKEKEEQHIDVGRKSFPSTRSLVSGLDEEALVSALFDEDSPTVEAETRRTAALSAAMTRPAPVPARPPRPAPAAAPPVLAPPPIVQAQAKHTRGSESPPSPPATSPAPPAARAAVAEEAAAGRAAAKPSAPVDPTRDMNDRFALGDYSGALDRAEAILAKDAADQEALDMAQNCRDNLEQMYKAKLGPLDRVPIVMVPSGELRWLSIDHRAGFVLSNIDGVSSLEMIIDVSGMPNLDALRILCELSQQRIISFR